MAITTVRQACKPSEIVWSDSLAEQIARCPMRIGIVSTGLVINGRDDGEKAQLEEMTFGVLVLDEAHKARAKRNSRNGDLEGHNNLMVFMRNTAKKSSSILIGTATPIQLHPVELWDLMNMLGQGAPQVLGGPNSRWQSADVMDYLSGARSYPEDVASRWELLKNPLTPVAEGGFYRSVRHETGLADKDVVGPRYDELPLDARDDLQHEFPYLCERSNPIIRHTIRRSHQMLEQQGLLKPRLC